MKIALVYDRVNKIGGAEKVLLALHEIFPQAPLYTSLYAKGGASWAKVFPKIFTSPLQKIDFLRDKHELLGTFMPIIFESFDFSEYDLVISVTSEAVKGIITSPKTKHLCYLLTPTRYLWSGYKDYFENPLLRTLAEPIVSYLRYWDKIAASRPDKIIAISGEVKKRIKKYYHKDSEIIFPPVDIKNFANKGPKREDYYLIVGRLVAYKKFDLAIKAFNKLKKPLYVVGKGSEEKYLKSIANKNIHFLGELTEERLTYYYRRCRGYVFPQEEDFGLVAVEAQAAGAPVIAYNKGGSKDTVIEGKTGLFFDRQNVESLTETVRKFEKMHFKEQDLKTNSLRFSKSVFQKKILELVKTI